MRPWRCPLGSAHQILGVIAGSIISGGGVAFHLNMVASP
jgi:uncharacterized membrane protein